MGFLEKMNASFDTRPVETPAIFDPSSSISAQNSGKGRRLLYISGFGPNPNSSSSGQKLAFSQIEAFSKQFEWIDVVYFTNELEDLDVIRAEPSWPANVRQRVHLHLTKAMRIAAALTMPHLPTFVAVRRYAAGREIARRLADPAYTDFYSDFSQGMAIVPPGHMGRFTFRQHDVVSKLYRRQAENAGGLKRFFYRFEEAKAKRWEAIAWSSAGRIETLSEEDAKIISQAYPATPTRCVPPLPTVAVDPSARTTETIVPGRLVFFGNMSRQENIDAVLWMARDILPGIRKQHPKAHLWVVGAHPPQEIRALEGDHIHVTGFVDNPMDIFAQAHLAAVPLRLGSGVKIKVVETIAAGIPTVTTPVGAEGIPADPLLTVVDDAPSFVRSVCAQL